MKKASLMILALLMACTFAYAQFPSGFPVLEHAGAEHAGEFKVGPLAALVPGGATLFGARGSLRLAEGLMLFVDGGQITSFDFEAGVERDNARYDAPYVQPGILFRLPLDAFELPVDVALRGTLFKAFFPAYEGRKDLSGGGRADVELELDAMGTSAGVFVSGSPMDGLDIYGGLSHHSLKTKHTEKFEATANSGRMVLSGGMTEDTTESSLAPTVGVAYTIADLLSLRAEFSYVDEVVLSAGAFLAF